MPAELSDICTIEVPIPIAAGAVGSYTFPSATISGVNRGALTVDFFATGDLYWRLENPWTTGREFWVPGRLLRRWRDRNLPSRTLYFANKYDSTEVTLYIIVEHSIDA